MKDHYAYWLQRSAGLTPSERRKLVTAFGNARSVYEASDQELSYILQRPPGPGFREEESVMLREYKALCDQFIHFIPYESSSYPENLRNISSAPFGLYTTGELPDLTQAVAIVGSRRFSAYGEALAAELGQALAAAGIPVISGMARGIDSTAQYHALKAGGFTVAVLGSGVDICYPGELKSLYNEIRSKGCILSELPPGTRPIPQYFPSRNRIISGLARTVIVVEASEKSGSLITADIALDQGRDVYACPGRIGDTESIGTNRLIAQGAGIITSVASFLEEQGYGSSQKADKQASDFGTASRSRLHCAADRASLPDSDGSSDLRRSIRSAAGSDHRSRKSVTDPVLELLDVYPRSISELKTTMSSEEILRHLSILEIQGLVRQQSPGKYVRLR